MTYKLDFTNATINPLFTWKNITISKLVYKEDNETSFSLPSKGIIVIFFTSLLGRKKVSISWTSLFGKLKTKKYNYHGGIIISW